MANTLQRFSIWEIAHRWHGEDCEQTDSTRLPLTVRDSLRSLTRAIHFDDLRVLSSRGVENHSVSHPQTQQRYTADEVQDKLSEPYEKGIFDRKFLESVFLEKEDIGKWCLEKAIPLPDFWFSTGWKPYRLEEDKLPDKQGDISLDDSLPTRPSQIDKQLCQAIARTLWDINPKMTIAAMCEHDAIQRYGNGKLYKGAHTLRGWLSEVAPPQVKGKSGRPKKESSEGSIDGIERE